MSPTELRFADWIRWSPAQPGVALLNVDVPSRGRTRQLDAVIWTRQRCIVIDLKGFRSPQNGTLVVPPNGPWHMDDGRVADIYGNDDHHNPMAQVQTNCLATKDWASQVIGRKRFVYGLVLVMLLPGQDVPFLDADAHPDMTDIIIEDFDVFRYYLHRLGTYRAQWTADEVDSLLTRLGVEHLYADRTVIAEALEEPTHAT
ncbi:nuclease-related domain-containing protein [Nocardia sp. CNY236]|uniref:nuclease-related domain-containing protein n=1 Tax=Nocardia sp. CNY236 TaxID=1169152 RepID=UPI0018CB0CAF|nr:nuclease-related domain-containing protein [Nocardia sp. CNY236]